MARSFVADVAERDDAPGEYGLDEWLHTDPGAEVSDDAREVLAHMARSKTAVPLTAEIRADLGWPMDRLEDALAELGDRPASVARELTKLHEEILRGGLSALLAELKGRPGIKGELVIVIGAE